MQSEDAGIPARKILTMFPVQEEHIRNLLSGYGEEDYEEEAARVQLAILKLSEGIVERIEYYVQEANKDYRDVLAWAEYPEQVRARTWELDKEENRRMQERDLEQYKAWLNEERPPDKSQQLIRLYSDAGCILWA